MLALVATLAIQALVSMTVLTPPVLAALAAPEIGVASERVGLFTALVYGGAIVSSAGSGALLARTGPLRLSQWCLVFCAAGIAVASAGSLALVVLGAVLMGLGYGPVTPASSHILIRQTAPQRRSLVFSLKQTGVPVGGALAGSVAAPLALLLGWRGAALAVAAASLVLAFAVEPLRPRFDAGDASDAGPSLGLLAGIRLVLRTPTLRRLALSSTTFSATQLSFATFVVTFLTERANVPLVTAGVVMAVAQGAGVVGRIVLGWAADRLLPPGRLLALLGIGMAAAATATGFIGSGWPLSAIFAVTAACWRALIVSYATKRYRSASYPARSAASGSPNNPTKAYPHTIIASAPFVNSPCTCAGWDIPPMCRIDRSRQSALAVSHHAS